MKLVDAGQMSEIDSRAQEEFGIPPIILMEHAAIEVYASLVQIISDPKGNWLFLAGPGNNGGDALAVARMAYLDGYASSVLLLTETPGELASIHLGIAKKLGIPVSIVGSADADRVIEDADIIVDGLFGTGLKPPVRENVVPLIGQINSSRAFIVAIDVPSGVGDGFIESYPAIRCRATVSIALPKRSLYLPAARIYCGEIEFVSIGFPSGLTKTLPGDDLLVDDEDVEKMVPPVTRDAHKGTRGRVGVFAGAHGMSGAPVLASEAAGRVGAGLIYLHLDPEVYSIVAPKLNAIMPLKIEPGTIPELTKFDSILAGPGWGVEGREAILDALIASGKPGVLDADAINIISNRELKPDLGSRWVLTPHPGELARLQHRSISEVLDDPYAAASISASDLRAVVVLKAHVTIVASPTGVVRVVDGMNPFLGTGGSGDVLSGMIAGLIARGIEPYDAAAAGVYLHARVGIVAARGGWFLAEDLLPEVSRIVGEVERIE